MHVTFVGFVHVHMTLQVPHTYMLRSKLRTRACDVLRLRTRYATCVGFIHIHVHVTFVGSVHVFVAFVVFVHVQVTFVIFVHLHVSFVGFV